MYSASDIPNILAYGILFVTFGRWQLVSLALFQVLDIKTAMKNLLALYEKIVKFFTLHVILGSVSVSMRSRILCVVRFMAQIIFNG